MKKSQNKSIYSDFEMGFMKKVHHLKMKIFAPLLKILDKLKVKPNYVSVFSVLTVIASFALAVNYWNPLFFIIGMWVHLIIDGIDGTLARFQKSDNINGAIFDVISDHFGIIFFCIFVVIFGFANVYNVSILFLLYSIIIAISLYFLKKNISFVFVLRPRIYLFGAVTYDYIIFIGFTELIAFLANILMVLSIFIAFYQLKIIKKKKH